MNLTVSMFQCRDMHAKKYWQEYKHTFYCKLKLYINVRFVKLYNINFAPIIVPLLPSFFAWILIS